MLEYHSELLKAAFEASGYKFDVMHSDEPQTEQALKYISSDYCLPSVLIIGQVLQAVKDNGGRCDNIAFMEPQAGGACRAGNIYNAIISTLEKLGCDIPVISLNYKGLKKHPGFRITPKLINDAASAVCFGDLLMLICQQTRPFELNAGETDAALLRVTELLRNRIKEGKINRKEMYLQIINEFSTVRTVSQPKKKVGVAGEIYIKYSSLGNSGLEKYLEDMGCQVYFGGFINYLIYLADSEKTAYLLEHKGAAASRAFDSIIRIMQRIQRQMYRIVKENSSYKTDLEFSDIRKKIDGIISADCINGDGWLIAAEAVQAIESGCKNVLIVHPFGCLVSHVCERGIIRSLKQRYCDINIQTVEYDCSQSNMQRESRILLGISD